jgi:tripartite-type tricarboxylate transporter receptor subunit TctC
MQPNRKHATAFVGLLSTIALAIAACAPAAPASPTAAPPTPALSQAEGPAAQPTTAAAVAKPAEAPAAKPAPTTAPAKTEAKPAEAKPAPSPAAKAEAKPAASPAAKPTFDEKAVADFYRGKTVRLVLPSSAGSAIDVVGRMVARHMAGFIPGTPTIIVENKAGAGGVLALNLAYNSDAKDGTAFISPIEGNVFLQAIGAPGIEFDATKFNWLGSTLKTTGSCVIRTDAPAKSIQDAMAGQPLVMGTTAPGTTTHDIATLLKPALGANFSLVPGYLSGAELQLALERKEIDGYCLSVPGILQQARNLLEGPNPQAKFLIVMGAEPFDGPMTKGVPAAETLAKTDEAKQMLRALNSVLEINKPFVLPPGAPNDRVQALRSALTQTYAKPQFIQEMQAAKQDLKPSTGEEVTRVVQALLGTPAPTLAKLKSILFGQ